MQKIQFFTVANILFNKSKTVEGKYDLIVRNDDSTGVYVEEKAVQVSKSEIEGFIANKIENVLKSAQNTNDLEVIGDQIKECVFKYSQDPGSLSATSNYVIGVDNQGKAVSSFVESFNEAGLKLYKNENRKFGDIAIAESEYGIHVLIYTGACENLFQGINGSFTLTNDQQEGQLSAIQVLAQTRVSPMLDKTIFDVLFDELNALYVNTPSYVQQANAELIRTDYQITNYRDRIPESLK